ncbi:PQQ-dependent dehydrogenase, methanol/ethanol family [Altericroceibacterium spongiae]|uniref:PQQ-dependent dehydrogenase, methanol/ethanol family n=1 Tax=Altericroceibacterium spongiae TaxID=2320269 RepID=A0A420ES83_9SPHN|nr:PQQ-dependent dehydrogenase, methanol/ethanol family [Altericroceibacterium spongiae]RKF23537.1 PQQ-dependent dehydrogenase, methanol/ethanol family [Altericroceibacterium spongiae]
MIGYQGVRTRAFMAAVALLLLIQPGLSFAERQSSAAVDQARMAAANSDSANWMGHGRTFDEQRFSPLKDINRNTVGSLSLAWYVDLDTWRGQEATPLVIDGTMYVSTAWSKVYAVDAASGKVLWIFDPQVDPQKAFDACCDVVNRGVAAWKGKIYIGTIDGRLIAIDAATGKQVWSVVTADPEQPYTITGAPRVFKDKIVIGNGGAEYGVRGYVTAYNTETGEKVWRFYTVPGDPAKGPDGEASDAAMEKIAGKSWHGEWWKYGGGGTVWDSIVYDEELDQLYIGVGNGTPWNYQIRSEGKGDNLFLCSIVALDPDTGEYIWHYQAVPGDSYDYTSTQPMMLATLPIDGKRQKVLMQAPKNGFFYVIDRVTGKLISANNYVPQTWAKHIDTATGKPVFADNARYKDGPAYISPSSEGGHNWMPMSFDPDLQLVFFPSMSTGLYYAQPENYDYEPGQWNMAAELAPRTDGKGATFTGALLAWDPVAQKQVWRVPQTGFWNGGTLATAGGLVFQGDSNGIFRAFASQTGQQLWSFDGQSGIQGGPISYAINGEQYIAVLAGKGGSGPLFNREGQNDHYPINGRILVFKLGGTAKLPAFDPVPRLDIEPVTDTFSKEQIQSGAGSYYRYCFICHGGDVLPNLRRSPFLFDAEAWRSVVIDGALTPKGMVSFKEQLSPGEAEAIRAYVSTLEQ